MSYVLPHIEALEPYSSARSEYSGRAEIYLDANENSYGAPGEVGLTEGISRYPDPRHTELVRAISSLRGISEKQICIGNGSDEAIDLLVRMTCQPGRDAIAITPPTYGMYRVAAATQGVSVVEAPLRKDYSLDPELVLRVAREHQVKCIFLCSPNNPTGDLLKKEDVLAVVRGARCLVVVDEAYIDFADEPSLISEINNVPNLVVLQTLSKAWGLAGARCGMVFSNPEMIGYLYKAKPPYNVSLLTQRVALETLQRRSAVDATIRTIIEERERLRRELMEIPGIHSIAPSQSNFLLVRCTGARAVYEKLLESGIVVRDRSKVVGCEDTIRITVGTVEENDALLAALRGTSVKPISGRKATVRRITKETAIRVVLNLDGGEARISTGIGFFDHMLEQVARHGGFGLQIAVRGDTHIDEHHTIEDTAIALGEAFRQALGDKRGIGRYGFTTPMDETLAQVAIDLSGRYAFQWQVAFTRELVGEFPTEMVKHFFSSFAESCRCALHVTASGENNHHLIEGIFKAFARVLHQAVQHTAGSTQLPSTKGVL
jgi:histidinol-phosphate aminotransferase